MKLNDRFIIKPLSVNKGKAQEQPGAYQTWTGHVVYT